MVVWPAAEGAEWCAVWWCTGWWWCSAVDAAAAVAATGAPSGWKRGTPEHTLEDLLLAVRTERSRGGTLNIEYTYMSDLV